MTKIIGLTGGIGSGKTTIANYLQSLGVPVYIADNHARMIMDTPEMLQAIEAVFGKEVFENKILSRSKLAQIVFNNPEKLQQLNAIIHPAVKEHFKQWVFQNQKAPFVFKEAAILFESGSYKECDFVITVVAPLETRIQRVMQRDHVSREKVLERIRSQWSDEERIAKSKFVIDNTSRQKAMSQVDKILEMLRNQ